MLRVPSFKQSDGSLCGPCAVRSVLAYYKIDTTEREVALRCDHSYSLGCTNKSMQKAFESYGLLSVLKNYGTLQDIQWFISQRVPVIVDHFSGYSNELPNGHSGIIVGIDKSHINLLDPVDGAVKTFGSQDFMRVWFDWEDSNEIDSGIMNIRTMLIASPKKIVFPPLFGIRGMFLD